VRLAVFARTNMRVGHARAGDSCNERRSGHAAASIASIAVGR
jgi:hypothetical protein